METSVIQGDNWPMKFASYSDGSRDGQLVVVSRDLSQAHYATHIATRLQSVLEDWSYLSPQLQDLYDSLNAGRSRHAFAFDPSRCLAPLPRSYHHVQVGAYPARQRLLRHGESDGERTVPPTALRSGDALWGPHAVMAPVHAALGLDFEVHWGAVTADIPAAATPERALDAVRLLVLGQSMVLRAGGGEGVETRLSTAFAPLAITPDEVGELWDRGRLHATVVTQWNGRKVGMSDMAADMPQHLGKLLSQLTAWSPLAAGTLVSVGPISNHGSGPEGWRERPKGFHTIEEKRALEKLLDGQPVTPYLQAGDDVRSEARGRDGLSLFGSVCCEVGPTPG